MKREACGATVPSAAFNLANSDCNSSAFVVSISLQRTAGQLLTEVGWCDELSAGNERW